MNDDILLKGGAAVVGVTGVLVLGYFEIQKSQKSNLSPPFPFLPAQKSQI